MKNKTNIGIKRSQLDEHHTWYWLCKRTGVYRVISKFLKISNDTWTSSLRPISKTWNIHARNTSVTYAAPTATNWTRLRANNYNFNFIRLFLQQKHIAVVRVLSNTILNNYKTTVRDTTKRHMTAGRILTQV